MPLVSEEMFKPRHVQPFTVWFLAVRLPVGLTSRTLHTCERTCQLAAGDPRHTASPQVIALFEQGLFKVDLMRR
jgi:hypothetical protein